ncbi:MAG: FIG00458426: hypothetical protein [uncultured Caballeronia sp.]|nr:MAG: FIG00458426: hypothetical protein [uncultured Caballeronia sp.]
MKRVAAVLVLAGSLAMSGQASAHGGGGAVIGALVLVGSAVAQLVYAQPMYQPVYAQPVYAQPAYQPDAPPGYCFDDYRRAYRAARNRSRAITARLVKPKYLAMTKPGLSARFFVLHAPKSFDVPGKSGSTSQLMVTNTAGARCPECPPGKRYRP